MVHGTSSSAPRTVYLGFSRPIDDTGPDGADPLPFASANYQVFMYTACNHVNYNTPENFNGNLLMLPAGGTMECPMTVQFTAGGKQYFLHMNSRGPVLAPGTDHVDITCASTSGPCANWEIRPSVTSGNLARLSYQGKGNAGLVQTRGLLHVVFDRPRESVRVGLCQSVRSGRTGVRARQDRALT